MMMEEIEGKNEPFAEKYSKYTLRDYKNNTRLNTNQQHDYAAEKEKRDRAINYW